MRHLDLFAGIGGFSLAARWMGWETVAQVEWDEWCKKVLAKNFPDALRFGDIVEFNKMLEDGKITTNTKGSECKSTSHTRTGGDGFTNGGCTQHLGHIDIITGGFPCQPFSHAGKRKGTDDSRYLWPAMLETIRRVKPTYVVGENVAGLVSMEGGKTLDRILSDLEDEGYTTEQVIIPACAVGAWHRRDRIWIIAHSNINGKSNGSINGNQGCGKLGAVSNSQNPRAGENHGGLRQGVSGVSGGEGTGEKIISNGEKQRIQGVGRIWKQGSEEDAGQGLPVCGSNGDRESSDWWLAEPSVGRVANGIPNRVDRLKGLGNAIVPQVAYEIFKAIEEYDPSL